MEHVKSRQGDKAVVDLFLTARMSPDAKSKEGISALTFASRGGHAGDCNSIIGKKVLMLMQKIGMAILH